MSNNEQYLLILHDKMTKALVFGDLYTDEQVALEKAKEEDALVVTVRRPAIE